MTKRDTYEELAYRRARRAKMKEEGRNFDPYLFFKSNPLMPMTKGEKVGWFVFWLFTGMCALTLFIVTG